MKYYRLKQEVEHHAGLLWDDNQVDNPNYHNDFVIQTGLRYGKPLADEYKLQNFFIHGDEDRGDAYNTKFNLPLPDFSTSTRPFYLISARVYKLLKSFFDNSGEVLPVTINEKENLYYGFHPPLLEDTIDTKKTIMNEWGSVDKKPFFIAKNIEEYHIFMAKEYFELILSEEVKEKLESIEARAVIFEEVDII